MKLKLKETDIIRQIREYSELYFGIHLYRIRENPWTSDKGLPDLMGWLSKEQTFSNLNAVPIFVEVKVPRLKIPGQRVRPAGHRRPDQVAFIEKAKADGCIAMFAESLEQFILGMNAFGIYGKSQKQNG